MSEEPSSGASWRQVAVAIGAGVTIVVTGCAVYYFWSKKTSSSKSHDSGSHDPVNKATGQDLQTSVSRFVHLYVVSVMDPHS